MLYAEPVHSLITALEEILHEAELNPNPEEAIINVMCTAEKAIQKFYDGEETS